MKAMLAIVLLFVQFAGVHAQPTKDPNGCNMGWALPPRMDPRNPDVICLPEVGTMTGVGAQYGNNIWPLPDLNNDGIRDWAIGHTLDTFVRPTSSMSGDYPREILIYRGERGQLPDPRNCERVGPTELGSVSWLVAAGDWDNSGSVDLAVAIRIIGDTSCGAGATNTEVNLLVIFWGDSAGHFSVRDTSRLTNGYDCWRGPFGVAPQFDADRDGVADLVTSWQFGFKDRNDFRLPNLLIWRGHDGRKWGRSGIGRMYEWSWWNAPGFDKAIDADGDGRLDLTGQTVSPPTGPASAWVLYGQDKPFPDTTALQVVDLWTVAQCETAVFSDVTGDRIPELVALSGGDEQNTIKIYVGLRGQRLAEQFGSGNDMPDPGAERWWGKPWALVWQPNRVNDYWLRNDALYDFGDADLDGIDDLWSYSWPFLIEYNSSYHMDMLIDAMIRNPGGGSYLPAHANLGDIDGSGIPTIAIGTGDRIVFYKMAPELRSSSFEYRDMPLGTGPSAVPVHTEPTGGLLLKGYPNPARDELELRWVQEGLAGAATITVYTEQGRKLATMSAAAAGGRCVLSLAGLPREALLIAVHTRKASGTLRVAHR